MFCLNAVDVKCPICGTINKSLDLEETDGWMECESCGEVTQQINYANISLLDMGLITEQEYQKMAVKITNSPDRLRQESRP